MGLWYYLAVPTVLLGLCAVLQPKPFFLFGAALALFITFIAYLSINWHASRPEGLLGLGHVFSLPGAIAGAIVAAIVLKRYDSASPVAALFGGLAGALVGFFINQLLVCNTVMWCGPLSLAHR